MDADWLRAAVKGACAEVAELLDAATSNKAYLLTTAGFTSASEAVIMKHLPLVALVALTLAGCTSDQDSSPPPSDDPDVDQRQWLRENHTATVEVKIRDDNGDHGRNCVDVYSEDDQHVSNVTASATWTHDAPTKLILIYWEAPSARNEFTEGTSPLRVDVPEPKLRPDGKGLSLFSIAVEPAIGHSAPDIDVEVELSFDHESDKPVEFWSGSCDVHRYVGPV